MINCKGKPRLLFANVFFFQSVWSFFRYFHATKNKLYFEVYLLKTRLFFFSRIYGHFLYTVVQCSKKKKKNTASGRPPYPPPPSPLRQPPLQTNPNIKRSQYRGHRGRDTLSPPPLFSWSLNPVSSNNIKISTFSLVRGLVNANITYRG